jgi:hypothetical protein
LFFHPNISWSLVPYLFLPYLINLLHFWVSFPFLLWLCMIHHLTFFIQISHSWNTINFLQNWGSMHNIHNPLGHCWFMPKQWFMFFTSIIDICWLFNGFSMLVVHVIIYLLNLFPKIIYFYNLDFYWSILILSGNILKVIHMYTMLYCSLYMTLNYFKSFFIIMEMKCKIWNFCQVSQNVKLIPLTIVSSTWINLCMFYSYFLP